MLVSGPCDTNVTRCMARLMAVFFLLATVDHCALFANEFADGMGRAAATVYALVPAALVACERKVASMAFDWPVRVLEWVGLALLAAVFLADSLLGLPDVPMRVISYVLVVYMIAIWVFSFVRLRGMRDQMEEGHHRYLLLLLAVSASMLVLGNLVQLWSPMAVFSSAERDLGSELFTVVLVAFSYVYLGRVFAGTKDPETVRTDILDKFARTHGLTAREREVLVMIVDGRSNQEIGNELWLSLGTVKTHAHNIYRKVGVTKRTELQGAFADFERTAL